MTQRIIFSGFGGQGIMSMGKILAQAAMQEDRFVTWLPSYGAEVRGGTAHCTVIISDKHIASPFIDVATTVIAMNRPSLDKFLSRVADKGLLIINSSLVNKRPKAKKKIKIARYPFTDIASRFGDIRVANMVALGVLLKLNTFLRPHSILACLEEVFKNENIYHANEKAFRFGMKLVSRRHRKH